MTWQKKKLKENPEWVSSSFVFPMAFIYISHESIYKDEEKEMRLKAFYTENERIQSKVQTRSAAVQIIEIKTNIDSN